MSRNVIKSTNWTPNVFIYRKSHLTKAVSSLSRKLSSAMSKDTRTSCPVGISIKASSWQTGPSSVCFVHSGGWKMTTQSYLPELLTGSAKTCLPAQVEALLESASPVWEGLWEETHVLLLLSISWPLHPPYLEITAHIFPCNILSCVKQHSKHRCSVHVCRDALVD